ncbi:unnamed protein product [Oppiella nova]|uniref:Multifunctional methyltransferase subunit TRM112-like protein n=1 Tax=Oppiella nova TaxID=334625 RepID=A0A7R9M451_9ACAR|nr:unnamed protein product [Oppiella nova]CAG2170418.1 unnamed protein product [Oppiella nova]
MKLLMHNMLSSMGLQNVTVGFPLKIVANEVKDISVEFDKKFMKRIISKVDWNALRDTAAQFGVKLPTELPNGNISDELLKQIHGALMEIEIIEGKLVCPETGHEFPINNGIPNMLF